MTLENALRLLSFGPDGWGDEIAQGAWLTIRLALTAVPFGLIGGLLLAFGRAQGPTLLKWPCEAFVTTFRGLPEILTIFIIYYGGQLAFQALFQRIGLPQVELDPFTAGVLALVCVFAAFSADVFLVSLRAVPVDQLDAARALGLKSLQINVFIVLPQLLRHALPGLSNLWLALIRDTSLVSVIALSELTRASAEAAAATHQPFLFYAVACLVYLAISLASSIGLVRLERWSERGLSGHRQ